MKTLSTLFLFLSLAIFSFGQSTCCSQIITGKTNKPFDCLKKVEFSHYTKVPTGSTITVNNPFQQGTYGYQGQIVRVFTQYPPTNSADIPVSYVVVNEACQVVCGWSDCCGIGGPTNYDPNNGCRVDFTKNSIPISGFRHKAKKL